MRVRRRHRTQLTAFNQRAEDKEVMKETDWKVNKEQRRW